MATSFSNSKGIGLVEIIIVVAIIGIALASLAGVSNLALRLTTHLKKNTVALNLASESIEAARAVKDENWSTLAALVIDTPYHPIKSGSPLKWALAAGSETINDFSRSLTFSRVYRDSNDDIIPSGGIEDGNTRKVITTVSWNESGHNYQVAITSYLANWKP